MFSGLNWFYAFHLCIRAFKWSKKCYILHLYDIKLLTTIEKINFFPHNKHWRRNERKTFWRTKNRNIYELLLLLLLYCFLFQKHFAHVELSMGITSMLNSYFLFLRNFQHRSNGKRLRTTYYYYFFSFFFFFLFSLLRLRFLLFLTIKLMVVLVKLRCGEEEKIRMKIKMRKENWMEIIIVIILEKWTWDIWNPW